MNPIKIPATSINSAGAPTLTLSYQYALFSGGKFARWEDSKASRTLQVAMPPLDDKIFCVDGGDSKEEVREGEAGNALFVKLLTSLRPISTPQQLVMLVSDSLRLSGLSPSSPIPTSSPVPAPPSSGEGPASPRSLKNGVEFMCIGGADLDSPKNSNRLSSSYRGTFTKHMDRQRSLSLASSSASDCSPTSSPYGSPNTKTVKVRTDVDEEL